MHEGHAFNWLNVIPVVNEWPNHVVMAAAIGLFLIVSGLVVRSGVERALANAETGLVPAPRMSFHNFFEILAEKLYGLTESVIGHHNAPTYFPLIGMLFVFILFCNLSGLVPGLLPPTDNINTTMALGLFVFVYYNFAGLREHGIGYFKQLMGPVVWLAPLMFVIELSSHLFRPISLAFRLRGNILGDHAVLTVFSGLVPYLVPVIFYGLGVFVSVIQSFVFCLLTMVYISLSVSHDH
jgi:F-type H+-transporting ATPase subunit a